MVFILPPPIGFSSSLKKKKKQFKFYHILCSALCLLPLPITQIVFSYCYPISCDNNIFPFSINEWLYIEAGSTIFIFLHWVVLRTTAMNTTSSLFVVKVLLATYCIELIFQLSWIVVGAIQFWRDCSKIEPQSINILMWVTLILGIFRSLGNNHNPVIIKDIK